jgi:hypothetical protein
MTTNTTSHTNEPTGVPEWSALFLLDVVARYAVDRCSSVDNLVTATASVACVLPIWVWVCSLVLMLVRMELYLTLARYSLTLLTLLQFLLLLAFHESPPVAGCGPVRSYPNAQTAISSYSFAIYVCYTKIDPSSIVRHRWLFSVMTIQHCIVIQSVLWIGFASPSSAIAGCVVGTMAACLLHEIVALNVSDKDGCLFTAVRWAENQFNTVAINTLIDPDTDDPATMGLVASNTTQTVTMGYYNYNL